MSRNNFVHPPSLPLGDIITWGFSSMAGIFPVPNVALAFKIIPNLSLLRTILQFSYCPMLLAVSPFACRALGDRFG